MAEMKYFPICPEPIRLTDAKEEKNFTDVYKGYIAINKNHVEWVRLLEETKTENADQGGFSTRMIYT